MCTVARLVSTPSRRIYEAEIVWLAGFGPEPDSVRRSWLVIQKHESEYADESGVHCEYPTHIPNGQQISVGDTIVCMVNAKGADGDGGRIFESVTSRRSRRSTTIESEPLTAST